MKYKILIWLMQLVGYIPREVQGTRNERLGIYEWMLSTIRAAQSSCSLCKTLIFYNAFFDLEKSDPTYYSLTYLPEIYFQRKGRDIGSFWWPKADKQSRIDALEKAIKIVKS